jgi:hypothetical protein
MSFTSIPNQPIIFTSNTAVDCPGCGGDYKQLLDFNDQVFFQLETELCDSAFSLIPKSSTFVNFRSVNGALCTDGGTSSITQSYQINFNTRLIALTFTILSIESGTLKVRMGGSSTYEFTLAGTYTVYFNNVFVLGIAFGVAFESTDFVGCINFQGIKVQGLPSTNHIKLGIVDATTLDVIDLITPLYTVKDNKITAAFRLSDVEVSEGCYRLAMTDYCTNTCGQNFLYNGNFIDEDGWVKSGNGGISFIPGTIYNQVLFDVTGFQTNAILTQDLSNNLCDGLTYNVTINIISILYADIFIRVGTGNSEQVFGTGLQTIQIVADGNSPIEIQVINAAPTDFSLAEAVISSISISIADEDIQWNLYSDVLSIGDYDDECKYFKIEGCNAEDQFNLAFGGSSFLPAIRLEGRKFRAQYVTEVNNFRFASGKYQTTYVDREKKWTFAFGRLPEYVLDFLSTIFYYDNCYVNGDLYYAIDGEFPDVEYNDADDLGAIAIDLALKSSKVRKTICSNTDADCLPSILDNPDEPFLLTQDDNRLVTEDSVNLYYEF